VKTTHMHHRKRRPHCTPEEYDAPWNLLEVTPELHRWIHDNPGLSYARGWLVHSWEDPRDVPVTPGSGLREVA